MTSQYRFGTFAPLPAPDVPDYSTLVVKDIQNIPADFTFDRVEVKVTGVDWQVIETLSFPYENGQIVMTLPTSFPSEKLQTVDRRNGMGGYWTGTSDDADALVATLGDFFVFNGDKRVGRIAISNWSGKGSSAGKATLVSYQYADRSFTLTGSDKSYYYSNCSFYKGWNIFANINPASEGGTAKVLRTTTVPESTLLNTVSATSYCRLTHPRDPCSRYQSPPKFVCHGASCSPIPPLNGIQ